MRSLVASLLAAALGTLAAGHSVATAGPLDPLLPDDPTSPELSAAQTGDVEVIDNEFDPAELSVEEGSTVTWSQSGDNPHSVTADDGSFDSHPDCSAPLFDCMGNGDTFEFTFEEAGGVPYFCKIHGGEGGSGMSGVIVVEAATGTDPGQDEPTGTDPAQDDSAAASDDEPAALAAQESTGDSLPVTGGPGVSRLAGSAMLGVAAGLWVLVRRRPGADREDART